MCNLIQDEDVKKYMITNDDNDSEYDEDELRNLGLDDYEIEEVMKGNQSPYDFNDDPDDDYYGEDDL